MSDETAPPNPVLAKATTRRKLARRGLVLLAVVLVGFGAYRLLSPPDIGEPFDAAAFTSYSLPDEQNAFTYYRRAMALFVGEDKVLTAGVKAQDFWDSWRTTDEGWEHAIPAVRRWVKLNRSMLDTWKRGASCAESLRFPLADLSQAGLWSCDWMVLQQCARLESFEGLRLTAERHPDEAWDCFRNLLRTSRHLAMHATWLDGAVGADIGERGVRGGVYWSAQKIVGAAELRKAIRDVLAVEDMRAPASDTIKLEYLGLRDFTKNRGAAEATSASWMRSTGYPAHIARTARLTAANLLTQSDRPRFRRTPVHPGPLGLFELDPARAADPKLRSPEEIERSAVTTAGSVANAVKWIAPQAASEIAIFEPQVVMGGLCRAIQTHDEAETRLDALLLALALQLHFREHGEFPVSLTELVKNGYLKEMPADPFGKGEPFGYRREAASPHDAVLWSVWTDGIDQEGREEPRDGKGDWIVRVRVPSTTGVSEK
jgi:hypothetical protein